MTTISTAELAECCSITVKTVSLWTRTWLKPAKLSRGTYHAAKAIRLWIKHVIRPAEHVGDESEANARRRFEIARANKEELRVKRVAESLVPRDEALSWVRELVAEARSAFLPLARRLAPVLHGKEIRDIEGILDDAVKATLRRLAKPEGQKGHRP